MDEIKLSELNPIVDVPNEALVYVVVDGISYRTTKEKLMAATTTNLQDGQELDLPYIGSNTFTLPDNYLITDVYTNIALNKKATYVRSAPNQITVLDTLEAGDVINVRGLVATGNFVPNTPLNLAQITSQGSQTLVPIQSPNAVNANDLVNLGQVEDLIAEIPSGGGCITAECVESLPTFDNDLDAVSLPNYTPYRTSTGELRYKLPFGSRPLYWIDTDLSIDSGMWID